MSRDTREKRKALGLCTRCGQPKEDDGRFDCEKCREEKNAKDRLRYRQVGDHHTAEQCKAYGEKKKTKYQENRAKGLCGRCGRPSPNQAWCEYCSNKRKILYNERKRDGYCVICNNKALPNSVYCEPCLLAKRDRERVDGAMHQSLMPKPNKIKPIPRSERPAHGLCYICGAPLGDYEKTCNACHKRQGDLALNAGRYRRSEYYKLDPTEPSTRLLYVIDAMERDKSKKLHLGNGVVLDFINGTIYREDKQ